MKKHWDLFCKIVDNFGDIGVCWRLAKQLQAEHGLRIRLFVDDLVTAQRIIPTLDPALETQTIANVEICAWPQNSMPKPIPEVVIEAFGCELPIHYLEQLPEETVWVNLEYLSAERWVTDFHGKCSDFGVNKPKRYFFYPGFTEKTGGLIREMNCAMPMQNSAKDTIEVSLFSYPFAPIPALLDALKAREIKVNLYVPASGILSQLAQYFGRKTVEIGDQLLQDNLAVHILPFLTQEEYDALLKRCDLNFVRGEDSWVRAIWACRPFIWQPYRQEENAHMAKLYAFLDLFYADSDHKNVLWKAHEYWAEGQGDMESLQTCLRSLPSWQVYTQQQSAKLSNQTDLATSLVKFCENLTI